MNLKTIFAALALTGFVSVPLAKANTLDVSFSYTQVGETYQYGSPAVGIFTSATGTLVVDGGHVTSGTLTVDGTGPGNGNYVLIPGSGGNNLFAYDNNWFIDETAGLLWSTNGTDQGREFNMWSTGANGEFGQPGGFYALWSGANANAQLYDVESYGNVFFSITSHVAAVPDGSATVGLLGLGLAGLALARRKLA